MTNISLEPEGAWIEWRGGECPVDGDTVVDLRFAEFDSLRVPPYIRHHEMSEQEASSVRWEHIGSGPAAPTYHGSNIIAYRVVKP